MRFFIYEYSEKRQAGCEEFFISFAVIFTLLCSFTSSASADWIELTLFTSFRYCETFSDKVHCSFAVLHLRKISIVNIAEQVFIRTVKVAGIYVAVGFAYKLMRAVAHNSALLCRLTEVQPDPVVKLTDADILVSHIILDIKVKQLYKEITILLGSHIQFAFFRRTERSQAGYKLKIAETLKAEKAVYPLNVFGTVAR